MGHDELHHFKRNIDALDVIKTPTDDTHALQIVQDAHTHGHFGYTAVHRRIRREGWLWPGMSKLIRKVVDSCTECQHWNLSNVSISYHPLRSIHAALPWDVVAIDIITSFDDEHIVPSKQGYKYILLIVDHFTSFVVLKA